ncbi:hypothetical protein CONPUDRAFT_45660 [Coniophora puteana RWD-64-598 SS2]|uniref:SLS1 N-terminal domain-containing protein n=1 Tax=Coniophora puteana (strain RWD-64-598) TaxID=741705 RepID=A0A5M3N5M6_CONPW|nr:uncharacterized protein CONPUDRAFT_45660 [Coniophora puteana RWD-64-598 SS2]EIW86616.1 hypothetical protein CONPUDRAFT_45660 [Coniophora puteana RWD-64-598 SS2]
MSTRLVRRTLLSPSWCSACRSPRHTRFEIGPLVAAHLSTSTSSPALHASKDQDASRGPRQTTRAEEYLASLRAAGFEPSLKDIERCRPRKHAEPSSVAYITQYNDLLSTLCHSFSREQLKRFAQLYGLPAQWTRSNKRKVHFAEAIIEQQWKWPSLKEAEKLYRDSTEECVETFPVTPSQLFLILGKDGADLLQLSIGYKVHIGLSSHPLALRVEGLRGDISELTQVIKSLKQDILEERYHLPTKRPIRQDLLQRISRLAGAYVENVDQAGLVKGGCSKQSKN